MKNKENYGVPTFPLQHPYTDANDVGGAYLNAMDKRSFVNDVAGQHGPRLRRFLLGRVRNAADVSDLVQEVYLRLLRVPDHETIRLPEAYVFALANHVLYQYRLRQARAPQPIDELGTVEQSALDNDPLNQSDTGQQLGKLEQILNQLSPKMRAAVILHLRDGHTVEEVGEQLGTSRHMAKKYLAKALLHCRQRLETAE